MDWMMTFSPSAFLRLAAPDTPTAIMASGDGGFEYLSNFQSEESRCRTEQDGHDESPDTDQGVTSRYCLSGDRMGLYTSPSFSSL